MPKSKKKQPALRSDRAAGTEHDTDILFGMARSVWACLWGDEQEELGENLSGVDLYEDAPETPNWAEKWATKLADCIVRINNGRELSQLYFMAQQSGFTRDMETFGSYLGMEAVGSGLHWTDSLSSGQTPLPILVPAYEFYEGAERSEPDIRFVHT